MAWHGPRRIQSLTKFFIFTFHFHLIFLNRRSTVHRQHGYVRARLPVCLLTCVVSLSSSLCVCVCGIHIFFSACFVSFFSNHSCCVLFFLHPSTEHVVINVGVSRFVCCYCCYGCCCCCFHFSVRKSYITVKSHTCKIHKTSKLITSKAIRNFF